MGYSKFKEICDKKGVKISEVVRGTGVAYATISSWKAGKYTPKMDKLQKIADYLGVTLGELTAEWEAATPAEIAAFEKDAATPQPLTDQERELLDMLHELNQEGRLKAMEYIKDLYDTGKYKKSVTREQTA
jgi:transcriptional regulator with XRE-family HTH domain